MGTRVEAAKQPHRLRDGQLVGELGLLELDAEPLAQRAVGRAAPAPPHPEQLHVPRVRLGEPLENLDRGGLAGAVGTEQSEAFTGRDGEIEPGDCDHVRVALDEAAAADRRHAQCGWPGGCFGSGVIACLSAWSSCIRKLFTPSERPRIFMSIPPPPPPPPPKRPPTPPNGPPARGGRRRGPSGGSPGDKIA